MINEKCFTLDWLESFRKQDQHSRIQTNILEKMIYAFHLLEQLVNTELEFVFKGGTCLVLLLEEGNRFSIDIDIVCKTEQKHLEEILSKVVETSKFSAVKLDERRSYQPGIPKAHYAFQFDSVFATKVPSKILLDVLLEDSRYPELVEIPIETKWIETSSPATATTPSVDAITGDKLTAYAPNTIGIPYFKGEQSFAMEICKQLFDLSKLFGHVTNMEVVAKSFQNHANQEIRYRDNSELSANSVLMDTIDTCIIITKGGASKDGLEKKYFEQLQRGIQGFGSGYLMTGHFRINDAIVAAARVAHLAAKLLVRDYTPIQIYEGQDIQALIIEDQEWNFLNRLKRQPDKSSIFYWYNTVPLFQKIYSYKPERFAHG